MFNTITINFDDKTHTLGNVVECLLFYDEVNLIVGIEGLAKLWRVIGVEDFDKLCNYGLRIFILIDPVTCADIPGHGEDIWTFFLDKKDMRQRVCEKALGVLHETEHLDTAQMRVATHYQELSEEYRHSPEAIKAVHDDIYYHFVHKKILQAQLEEIGSSVSMFDAANQYEFRPVSKGFAFKTNMLCGELEEQAKQAGYEGMFFKHQRFLMEMTEVYSLIYFAAEKDSSILTTPSQSLMASCKQKDLLEKSCTELRVIQEFERLETNTFINLVSAVDSGEKSSAEIFELLDAAQEFKQWKRDLPDAADFLHEYQNAMLSKLPWVQRTSGKVLRFIINIAAGLAHPAVGVASSAFDAFVLDKWKAGGWKPAQFVTGNLKKFLAVNQ